jgi:AraC-like DNA-binding protein
MNAQRSGPMAHIPAPTDGPPEGLRGRLLAEEGDWQVADRGLLLLALDGVLRVQTDAAEAVVVPGLAAWVSGGTRYRVQAPRGARVWWLWCPVGTGCDGGLRAFTEAPLLRAAAREEAAWSSGEDVAHHLAAALVGLVPTWCAAAPPLTLPRARSPRLRRALDWLAPRLERPIGLPDAAKAAGLSERTLQRRCRAELELSLSGWLSRARMLRALAQLAEEDAPIAGVALKCGYQSPAAFTRAFSALVGSTPSAWRSQSRTS